MKTRSTLAVAAAIAVSALTLKLGAQDLSSASLEELMDIEVFSVAKKAQRLGATAASVYVITSEDIRRSGIRTVPELLRMAPGVQVARTQSGGWAISIRGFADEFSNKLLVLVDGRRVYDELYGGTFWELQDMLVDDIARIEVVRGPGAAMWGINAVNGVINIITRDAWETAGTLLKAAAGTQSEVSGAIRTAGRAGSKAAWRVGAYYAGHGPFDAPESLIASSRYGWNARRLDFRVDWSPTASDTIEFGGGANLSQKGYAFVLPSPSNLFPGLRDQRDGAHSGSLQAIWKHKFSDRSDISLRAAWTKVGYQLATANQDLQIGEFEFAHNVSFGRNALVWGLNYRDVSRSIPPVAELVVTPANSSQDTYAGFFANQFELVRDKLYFVAGLHTSDNQFTGFEIQPTGRLLWTPSRRWTGWAAVSRAVRTPTLFERNFNVAIETFPTGSPVPGLLVLEPNRNFRSEPLLSYEAGQRYENKRFSLDISGFLSYYQRLAAVVPGATQFVPPSATTRPYVRQSTYFDNARSGRSRGMEAAVTWTAGARWRLAGGYSWFDIQTMAYSLPDLVGNAYRERHTPRHQFEVRSYFDLTETIELDAALYHVGRLPDGRTDDVFTPAYLRGDLRLGWRPNAALEISAGVQNAFDPSHPEMISSSLQRLVEVPRNVYGSVSWRF